MSTGNYKVCIISARRWGEVEKYTLALFPEAYLIIPQEEVQLYKKLTDRVIPQKGEGVSGGRNTALDIFKDNDILMLDDDVKEIGRFIGGKRISLSGIELENTIEKLFEYAEKCGAMAFSCSPVADAFYYDPRKRISKDLFLIGTFSGYLKGCPVRFDETLLLKEDYDFTVKVWLECGIALRFNDIYCDAIHRTNKGGAVAIRNDETEAQAIGTLLSRWPQYIRINPRRRNEVLLRLK